MTTNGQFHRQKKPNKKKRPQIIELMLPLKALSTNEMWQGRKQRSYGYKNFRRKTFKLLQEYQKEHGIHGNMVMYLSVGFSSKAADLSNALKAIEDVLMEYFGMDDKRTVDIHLRKYYVYRGDEFIKVKITRSRRKNVDLRLNYKKGDNPCGLSEI